MLLSILSPDDPKGSWTAQALEEISAALRMYPFTQHIEKRSAFKRKLYEILPKIIAAAGKEPSLNRACFNLLDEARASGYIATVTDRKVLVEAGAWRPALAVTTGGFWRAALPEIRAASARLYICLAEHVQFYDDFMGKHPEFWDKKVFEQVLAQMPLLIDEFPHDMEAGLWELYTGTIEMILKTIGFFLMFWTNTHNIHSNGFEYNICQLMPLLKSIIQVVTKFDGQFGKEISAKARGGVLEEIVRLCGLLSQYVNYKLEENTGLFQRRSSKDSVDEAMQLVNFLVRVLMLKIPTCVSKADSAAPGSGAMPADERQIDSEWIEGLVDALHDSTEQTIVPNQVLADLFRTLVDMPVEEQKYRLESLASLVPSFIANYQEQLKNNFVPPMLQDLKVVLNAVLQDDTSMASELLDEISFFPCLLDFASKRSIVQSVCEHHRMQASSSDRDPIRLVVPRDNVLDGVCSSLNLQDQQARIEVPVEIEFRSGYADDNGQELVDEGEDQGGLRRQWLDRASRHFIASDLFISPSDDASHLATSSTTGIASQRSARGSIFVPSPESICRCVQDDWEEQFELFGCVLGFAILYKETIPVHFGHNFLRSVFGLKTASEDLLPLLESVDATLHRKLVYILGGDYKMIGDTLADALEQSNLPSNFVINESHCPELVKTAPLKPDGETIDVTEENKEEFVNLLLHRVLISGVAHQVQCFRRGLLRVVPEHIVARIGELMTVKEIQLMVCGIENVDVDDWEKHTQYDNGFTPDHQVVRWFWEVVRDMDQTTRANLLSFTTGSSQVPSGGFRFLQPELFTIQKVAVEDRFPEAHTCANTIDLPLYSSREELERKLLFAIQEAGDAFGRR